MINTVKIIDNGLILKPLTGIKECKIIKLLLEAHHYFVYLTTVYGYWAPI